jgi:hypothetical protein
MLDEAATLYLQDLDRFEIVSQTIAGLRTNCSGIAYTAC